MAKIHAVKLEDAHGQSEWVRIYHQLKKNKLAMAGLVIFLLEIILAVFATVITPYGYMEIVGIPFQGPSAEHWFGVDDLGRDIFSRVLYGGRYSLSMGFIAVCISTCVGMLIGAIAGYFGGQVDNILMRILDVIQALPSMLLMIVISAALGSGFFNTILALSFNGMPAAARMLRAQILKERGNEYIEACVSINCSKRRIILNHLIPNCWSPNLVQATMGIARTIGNASALSFIGLGVQPPIPEWGAMLSGARAYIRQAPHLIVFPGLAIAITVLALNLFGDGLRDAMDPKLKN